MSKVTGQSGKLRVEASLYGSMPSGIAITPDRRRKFLCFPRWIDGVPATLMELREGVLCPYPDAHTNRISLFDPAHHLQSVQSVVATDNETLWVLDTGRPYFFPALPRAGKLLAFDLRTNTVRCSYEMPRSVALWTTYMNDVRFDKECRYAYITDSATFGPSALIVVDLTTGAKLRRLNGHPSVQPEHGVVPLIEGDRLLYRFPFGLSFAYRNGVDGIALSPDGNFVYYCPLSSRRLYRVDAQLLADPLRSERELEASVVDLGEKCVSDGLECAEDGTLYAGDLEEHRIAARGPDGSWRTVLQDPAIRWADSLCIVAGPSLNRLYFTSTQIHLMWPYHAGRDLRRKPYHLFSLDL